MAPATGSRDDASGCSLVEQLTAAGFEVTDHQVRQDGRDTVATAYRLSRDFAGLIRTTGGTGFALHVSGPRSHAEVIEPRGPGLAEAMRAISLVWPVARRRLRARGSNVHTPGSPKGLRRAARCVTNDVLPHVGARPGATDEPLTLLLFLHDRS